MSSLSHGSSKSLPVSPEQSLRFVPSEDDILGLPYDEMAGADSSLYSNTAGQHQLSQQQLSSHPSSQTSSPLNSLTLDLPLEPKINSRQNKMDPHQVLMTSDLFNLSTNSHHHPKPGSVSSASGVNHHNNSNTPNPGPNRSPSALFSRGCRVITKIKSNNGSNHDHQMHVERSSSSRDGGSQFYLSHYNNSPSGVTSSNHHHNLQTPPPIRSNTLRSQRSNSETSLNSHSPLSIPMGNRRLPMIHGVNHHNLMSGGLIPSRITSSDYHSDTSSSNDYSAHATWFLQQQNVNHNTPSSSNATSSHDHQQQNGPPHLISTNNNNGNSGLINRGQYPQHQPSSSADQKIMRPKFLPPGVVKIQPHPSYNQQKVNHNQNQNHNSSHQNQQIMTNNPHPPVQPSFSNNQQQQPSQQQYTRGPLDRFRSKSTSNKSSGSSCSGRYVLSTHDIT